LRSVRTTAKSWLDDCLTAVRFGTPLDIAVYADPHVLLYRLVNLRDFCGTKLIDLFFRIYFVALVLHTGELHGFSVVDTDRQMFFVAANAKLMAAFQGEEVMR